MAYLDEKRAEGDVMLSRGTRQRQPGPVINPGLEVSNWGPFESQDSDFPTGANSKLRATRSPDEIRIALQKLIQEACG